MNPPTSSSAPLQRAQKPIMKDSNTINNTNNNNGHHSLFEVRVQARVRAGPGFSSQHLTDLPEGSFVVVEHIINNRARIIRPFHGWISVFSKSGQQIIMPVNKETEKIGGKAIFKQKIKTKHNTYKCIEVTCDVVDYNQSYNVHKIQTKNGNSRWISLTDPHIRYISKEEVQKQTCLEPVYRSKRTETFFEQCFSADYPQFAAKNRVTVNANTNIVNTSNRKDADESKPKECNEIIETQSVEAQPVLQNVNKEQNISEKIEKIEKEEDAHHCDKKTALESTMQQVLAQAEFIKKMKMIENKIIEHLHFRGYFEDNPDFWKYIAKAKEIAVAKVQKEKDKYLETQLFQGQPRNNCVY